MKIKILLISICLTISSLVIAQEIKLVPDNDVEKNINYNTPERDKLMESSSEKLHNNGIILQNSITPIQGLNYNSTRVINEPDNSSNE